MAPKLEDKEGRIGTSEAIGSGGGKENFGAQNFGDESVWGDDKVQGSVLNLGCLRGE